MKKNRDPVFKGYPVCNQNVVIFLNGNVKTWVLFLFPFFVTLLVLATGFLKAHPEELFLFQIGMLAVCAPPATLLTQFAVMFRKDAFLAGSVNLISMVLCVITMPLMIALFTYLAG